ncbi:type III-B CRISPR module RAMP protein Cmr4 [Persephonella sp. KM09-Lau-8]|uniref:type III-B CRISPR module RAMP protein Cmr4 n=1 Tax=Persephonella sp. KM09-Lau-8 TaxID=1158345 RepID=UPI000B2933FD|nr:type III-B CRISPR module RAMP protein Cmr4 [Persephonella sp. KM09-Lau-8]
MSKKIAFYHCHTPLHIGSGTTLDIIDLPIQREAHTDFPVMPSSSIKGVIRAEYGVEETNFPADNNFPEKPEDCSSNIDKNKCKEFFEIFGYGDKEGDIIFTDGKILLFPVKSVKGVFAWITCPLVLERFQRDTQKTLGSIPNIENNKAIAGEGITINNKHLVLEELSFEIENEKKELLAEIQNFLPESLKNEIPVSKIAILSNDTFKYFVKNHTEVNARTRID